MKEESDARIFSVLGTALNFIGLVAAIMAWKEERTAISVAIGSIIMAIGCMSFAFGQYLGNNKKEAVFLFCLINIWILTLIPISCLFNGLQGIIGGYWWTAAPIPQLGNSVAAYVMCWIIYIAVCVICDVVLLKQSKR